MTQFPYENRFRHYLDYDRNVENNTREDILMLYIGKILIYPS